MVVVTGWHSWKWVRGEGQGYTPLYKFLVPLPVRRWGGYGKWFAGRYGPSAQKARAYRISRYLVNVARDAEARARGYCNHAPWPAQGGYAFWRCARKRSACRIMVSHRSNNYVWDREGEGRVMFAPIPHTEALAMQMSRPYRERFNRRTLRQEIAWRRMLRAASAASEQ